MEIISGTGQILGRNVVTNITQSRRNENRVNIYIDGKFEFSLDLTQVVDFKIKVGRQLEPHEITEYRHASEFGKLYQRALEWVLMRPRSVRETRDHLKQSLTKREIENRHRAENKLRSRDDIRDLKLRTKPMPLFTPEDIENVIERLQAKNYLNDENFAKFYIENRNVKKGISERRLRQELAQKGVSQNVINNAFATTERDPSEEIAKIIAKKRHKYNDAQLINYLVRQGFEYELVQNLVRETDSQN